MIISTALSLGLLAASITEAQADAQTPERDEITEITVSAERVANLQPAGTFAAPVTSLRFDPLAEIQSRGIAEGQSDVTVRGGVFENTGFKVGAVTVVDPQTGHYVAELAIDPAFLSSPAVYSGIDNAVAGFNSTIATVAYGIRGIANGGSLSIGAGTDALNFQSLNVARTKQIGGETRTGAALSVARSEADGSLDDGDHEFSRYNLHLQRQAVRSQSDLILGYQDKFYGWPGAYTGFASLPETDDTQTTLLVANHRADTSSGWLEVGGFYRRLVDDYDFDRTTTESGAPGSFDHETRVIAAGAQGLHATGTLSWRYGVQVTRDELVRSTDLTSGDFTERTYATLTMVPSREFAIGDGTLTVSAGATVDYSNRDSNAVSPLFGATLGRPDARGYTKYAIEYAATSQLPGYTALKSNPAGLFGGNADLGRERAKQLLLSVTREADNWHGRAAVFVRKDDDLVDWTFATGAPFARQANPVDIDVVGFESYLAYRWPQVDVVAGFTYLDKDEDYGSAQVDASFYALNFARHRATLALKYRFADGFELRIDNEYRRQENNPLRAGDDATYLASLALAWNPGEVRGLDATLVADNLTDSEYQPFPGTPAAGRQVSIMARYSW